MAFEIGDAISAGFNNAFSWIGDSKALKYLGIYTGIFIFILLLPGLVASSPSLLPLVGIFTIIGYVLLIVIAVKMIVNALDKKGFKTIDVQPVDYFKYLVFMIFMGLHASFSWFDKKFLALGIIGAITSPFLIGIPLLLVYYVAVLRNFYRLMPGLFLFFQTGKIDQSLQESWNLTAGKALKIMVGYFAVLIPSYLLLIGLSILVPFLFVLMPIVVFMGVYAFLGIYSLLIEDASKK